MDVFQLTQDHCQMLTERAPEGYSYTIEPGRKYYKIIMNTDYNSRSVHAFVDKSNADLYKAASWKSPAKGVRFNLEKDREKLDQIAHWAGGYLYK